MATYEKRNKRWRAQVRRKGIVTSKSFDLKSQAVAWALETENQIDSGTYGKVQEKSILFRDVMLRYLKEVTPSKLGHEKERIRINALCNDPIADFDIESITPEIIGNYRDRRLKKVQNGTVCRDLGVLSTILEHAKTEWRLVTNNPVKDIRKPKEPKHRERLPTEEEIDEIIVTLGFRENKPITTKSQQIAVSFLIAIETGMRSGEILTLTWNQINLEKRVARLDKTKNGDKREIPLSKRAIELFTKLQGIHEKNCFTVSNQTRVSLFRKTLAKCGIKDLHYHDSRALALTRLSKKLNVLELAKMIGHRDPRSLMIYYRESAEEIAKKLD